MHPIRVSLVGAFLLMASIGFADELPVEVISVAGSTVMVSPTEIKRAYMALAQRKSKNADSVVANEDGSVAITRPTFSYNGRLLRIGTDYLSPIGVCKRFGFETSVGNEPATVVGDATIAYLSHEGKLTNLLPADPRLRRSVLETVACQ